MRLKKSGFTLVELLVVIAIISIISVVTASTFKTAQIKARDAKRKAELNAVAKALQMYYVDNGRFPNGGGDPVINDLLRNGTQFVSKDLSVIYMKSVPVEKYLTSKPFFYEVSRLGKSFNLFADLENREDSQCQTGVAPQPTPFIRNGQEYCYGIASSNTTVGTTTPD